MKEKYNFSRKSGKNFETLTFFQTPKVKVSGEHRKSKQNENSISDPNTSNITAKCRAVNELEFVLNNNFILSEHNTHLTFEITNKLVDYVGLRTCLTCFMRALKRKDSNIKYVWVLDVNEQGFVHIHMIINRYFEKDERKKLSKKWHKKVCGYYGQDGHSDEKICNINFTPIYDSEHLESVFLYLMSKPSVTYPLKALKGKTKYSRSQNLDKKEKTNGFSAFNIKKIKKELEEKYGKFNVKLDSYYDYQLETKIYSFKVYKGRFD